MRRRQMIVGGVGAGVLLGGALFGTGVLFSTQDNNGEGRPPRDSSFTSTPEHTRPTAGEGATTATDSTDVPTGPTAEGPGTPPNAKVSAPRTDAPPDTTHRARPNPNTTARPAQSATSSGWTITVYVTPVERFYDGPAQRVRGCPTIDCDEDTPLVELGSYPRDFVRRVQEEGTGRLTSGRYLNWSAGISSTGFWLDSTPRDGYGRTLVPFVSAAADGLPPGTEVTVLECGRDEGEAPPPDVCERFRSASWRILDQFTPGLGGERHIDLYLGEETGPGFTETSQWWVTLTGATLSWPLTG